MNGESYGRTRFRRIVFERADVETLLPLLLTFIFMFLVLYQNKLLSNKRLRWKFMVISMDIHKGIEHDLTVEMRFPVKSTLLIYSRIVMNQTGHTTWQRATEMIAAGIHTQWFTSSICSDLSTSYFNYAADTSKNTCSSSTVFSHTACREVGEKKIVTTYVGFVCGMCKNAFEHLVPCSTENAF